MADTKHHPHAAHVARAAHGRDSGAAFVGLVVGMVLLLALVGTVVALTNRHYANEKPAAGASH